MRTHLHSAPPSRSGIGLIGVSLALIVLGMLTLIGLSRLGQTMARHRVDRATALVASDLEHAFAIAKREGKPLRLACTCESASYQVTDRSGHAVRLTRALNDSSFAVGGLAFSTTPVDISPSGIASAPDTVTISAGDYARRIIMTTAGEVKILP
jgi:type II secretory pathway pseudopilin PulG